MSPVLPTFPDIKSLTLSDKNIIEEFTARFLPYSDYNFTSLWSYNTAEAGGIALLHDNLVLRFTDYITSEIFYSFLGINRVPETIVALMADAKTQGYQTNLRLVPDVVTEHIKAGVGSWQWIQDRDSYDYVYAIDALCTMSGNKLRSKKNFIHRFERQYGARARVIEIDLKQKEVQQPIFAIFDLWVEQMGKTRQDSVTEMKAIHRLIEAAGAFTLCSLGIEIDGRLVGFSINEMLSSGYSILHFEKADTQYVGVYPYLWRESARRLQQLGAVYYNAEQDLGIEGLRLSKSSYRPIQFLKKYTVASQ